MGCLLCVIDKNSEAATLLAIGFLSNDGCLMAMAITYQIGLLIILIIIFTQSEFIIEYLRLIIENNNGIVDEYNEYNEYNGNMNIGPSNVGPTPNVAAITSVNRLNNDR